MILLTFLIWLAPGFALSRGLRVAPARDPLWTAATVVVLSAFVSTAAALLSQTLGLGADQFYGVLVALAILAVPFWFFPDRKPNLDFRAPVWITVLGSATVVALAAYGLWAGASLRYTGDAPDHVGTLREILSSGMYFPTEAYHAGAGLLGADPRKGLLHPVLAALSRIAGKDPIEFWLLLPGLTAVFPFLGGYGFLRGAGFSAGIALLGGWCLLLSWSGGIGGDLVGLSPYPNQIGAALFWTAVGAALLAFRRPTFSVHLFAGFAGAAAVADHPMYVVFLAFLYGVLGLYVLFAAQPQRQALVSLLTVAGITGILVLPYLAYRWTQYAPANPIHTEIQGMLMLGPFGFVADPARLWRHVHWPGLVAYPLILITYARSMQKGPGPFFLFWSTFFMVFLLTLNPVVVPLLQHKLSYLIFRSFWIFPPGLAAAAAVGALLGRSPGFPARQPLSPEVHPSLLPRRDWGPARLLAASVLVCVCLPTLAATGNLTRTVREREGNLSSLSWREIFRDLDTQIPVRSVLVTDPVTSQLIPAYTSHKVVSAFDQHSSPNDSLAVRRLLTVRDVLAPLVSTGRAWSLTRNAGAEYVLLNRAFARPPLTAYWIFDRGSVARRYQDFLDSAGFDLVWERDGFSLFRLAVEPPPRREAAEFSRRLEKTLKVSSSPISQAVLIAEGLALMRFSPRETEVAPGDTLVIDLAWQALREKLPPEPVTASLRLQSLNAPGSGLLGDKLWRKLDERLNGYRLRARTDWIPAQGRLPLDRWQPGRLVEDTARLLVPETLAPGDYAVTIALNRLPHMPNHSLRDYFQDDDLYSGIAVDTLQVKAGGD